MAEEAERRRAEVEQYAERQVAANKNLLEALLEKQRKKLEAQLAGCTCQAAARREAALEQQLQKQKEVGRRLEASAPQSTALAHPHPLTVAPPPLHRRPRPRHPFQERVEMMHKQSARRLANQGIFSAFGAWLELWTAKTTAMERLREVCLHP